MDIFSLFRGTQNADAAAPAPQKVEPQKTAPLPGGESSTLETRGTASNDPPQGTPNQSATPAKTEGEAFPLAGFEKMWENTNTGKGQMPSLNADPAKISEAAKKIDFSKGIDPALLQKAVGGDVNALAEALNQAAQNAFSIATQASTHLVDKHVSAASEYMRSELPGQFKSFQAQDGLLTENPRLANPAVQPLIQVIQAQLAQQFPQATAAELRQHAQKYLSGVVSAISPEGSAPSEGNKKRPGKQQEAQAKNQFDWENWAKAESTDTQSWQ